MSLATPDISPQVTQKGIEELRSFPKIRDYDQYWEGLRCQLDPSRCRIVEYGTAHYEDRDYTLRAIEVGEAGDPLFILQAGTHGYEMSGPRAIDKASSQQSFLRASTGRKKLIVPVAQPRAFEHDLRYVVGKNYKGDLTITDTNRDFYLNPEDAETEESKYLIGYYQSHSEQIDTFMDPHETPMADVFIWRPFAEKYKGRDLSDEERVSVPQGAFVIVETREDQTENQAQLNFGHAVMDGLAEYSPRAPEAEVLDKPNDNGVTQGGSLAGSTRTFMTRLGAEHVVVTELNPDMPGMSKGFAMQSQMAGIEAALRFER